MLELGSKFLISYLIGSLMGAMIMGKLRGGVDIRKMGSGNAGGTNALRTQGFWFALGVVIIDIGKGVIGTAVIPGLELPWVAADPTISRDWLTIACAAGAVMGHVWPMYHRFEGGKGAATLIGTILVLKPMLVPVLLVVFACVLVVSGFVGLSTMTAATALPIVLAVTELPEGQPLFIYTAVMALYIIWAHRSNIARMRAGTENRNPKVMLFKRSNKSAGNDAA
ncbi:MAG: glycerol-3-phosphate 1-O-acyltransferase PlsY [Woeseiaceae bacterium]|nr:glycerol-3-phosphate 1-O-acyltransferase PlsY [Woeseiaceae bacterium]